MAVIFGHPEIGKVMGKRGEGVIQFLGIPFATLKDRFAEAEPVKYDSGATLDATKLGPSVLSPPNAVDFEQSLIQHTLPYEGLSISDLEGLIVNITVPTFGQKAIEPSRKLPVFVFIYGGGFNIGSSSWPEYDFSRIINHSTNIGTSVIGVSFNYRLGLPGFLTSKELRAAGYKPNNGIRDQRLALRWVKKYIEGFGGDADNITVAGESAGGASVLYQLQSEEPLFNRAVPMSGSDLLVRPMPLEATEGPYSAAMEALGLESASAEERIKQLSAITGEDLLAKTGMKVHVGPVADGETIKGAPSFEAASSESQPGLPGMKWCSGLMIGDCAFDGNIMSLQFGPRKAGIRDAFLNHLHSALGDPGFASVCTAYSITPESSDDEVFMSILRLTNDIGFYAPTTAYAQGFAAAGSDVYMYRFNELNPWEGPWKGESTHILDVAFLFQNYNEHLSEEQRDVAVEFAENFIQFVAGKKPWQAWKKGQEKALVLEGGKVEVRDDTPAATGRREAFVELAEKVGYDKLSQVWLEFLRG